MLPAHVRALLVFAAVALTACAAGDAPTAPSAGPVLDQTTPPPPPRSDSTTAAHPTQPWY
jgi:hypothetical protein